MDSKRNECQQLNQYLHFFLIISLLVAGYVGFRMPNLWSINYYIPDFFDGFYRRGLMGTILSIFGDIRFNYYFIATIQFTVFAILLFFILRYTFRAEYASKIIVILYFLAPTGGYLFHETGYIDQLLYLLLFVAIFSSNLIVGLGLMLASLFIHEEAMLTIIPIYISCLIIKRTDPKWILTNILLIGFTFGIITLCLQTAPAEAIQRFMQKILSTHGPGARIEYYVIFNNTFAAQALTNTSIGINGVALPPPRGHYDSLYFEIGVICLLACLISREFIDKKNTTVYNLLSFFSVLCSCISPLLLVLVGIDSHRWVFLSYSSSVILFCLIKNKIKLAHLASIIFVFALFLAHGKLWYFDNYAPRLFEKNRLIAFYQHEFIKLIKSYPVY